jgi:hypothetical protein
MQEIMRTAELLELDYLNLGLDLDFLIIGGKLVDYLSFNFGEFFFSNKVYF